MKDEGGWLVFLRLLEVVKEGGKGSQGWDVGIHSGACWTSLPEEQYLAHIAVTLTRGACRV